MVFISASRETIPAGYIGVAVLVTRSGDAFLYFFRLHPQRFCCG